MDLMLKNFNSIFPKVRKNGFRTLCSEPSICGQAQTCCL